MKRLSRTLLLFVARVMSFSMCVVDDDESKDPAKIIAGAWRYRFGEIKQNATATARQGSAIAVANGETGVGIDFPYVLTLIFRALASSVFCSVMVNTPSWYWASTLSSATVEGIVTDREKLP